MDDVIRHTRLRVLMRKLHNKASQQSGCDAVSINSDRVWQRRSYETHRKKFIKYACWAIHTTILMQSTCWVSDVVPKRCTRSTQKRLLNVPESA